MKSLPKNIVGYTTLCCLFLVVSASTAFASPDCAHKAEFETVTPGVLTISLVNTRPYDYVDLNGEFKGIGAAVLKRFAKRYCLELKALSVSGRAAIQYVVTGRSDISANGWYITAERHKVVDYTQPIWKGSTVIVSREGWNTLSDLKGRTVGTVQGFLWVPPLEKFLGDNLSLYPTLTAALQDLKLGRLEANVKAGVISNYLQSIGKIPPELKIKTMEPTELIPSTINPPQNAIIYTQGNDALGKALNALITQLKQNGGLKPILEEYGLPHSVIATEKARILNPQ